MEEQIEKLLEKYNISGSPCDSEAEYRIIKWLFQNDLINKLPETTNGKPNDICENKCTGTFCTCYRNYMNG
jgi:hypothetical protein